MKKISILFIICILLFGGCEDFLDTQNYTKQTTANFPKNVTDAKQILTGIYNTMSLEFTDYISSNFLLSELASDDRLGGGGGDDRTWHALDKLMNYGPSMVAPFWKHRYEGIFRTNMAIETMGLVTDWESQEQRDQLLGEIYFLRGYFYFTLVQVFGEVPLVLRTAPENLPKSPAADIYAQAASDLKTAIEMLPAKPYTSVASGHATKWAAQAMMARMFLFYTGYYDQQTLPLVDGGTISKAQVITWLDDCVANSGHSLVSDARNIWPYTNELTGADYQYVIDNNLKWEGDGSKETVFAVKFSTLAAWGSSSRTGYSNQVALATTPRDGNGLLNTFPLGRGWGGAPVSPKLWNDWASLEPGDIRREGSIFDVTEFDDYIWGDRTNQAEETGYWQKKYAVITVKNPASSTGVHANYTIPMFGFSGDAYLSNNQDLIVIRLADVLLMQSELKEDAVGLNLVRTRSGLAAKTYSLAAIKQERRFELCFEGQRYYDLMRWGDAADAMNNQIGVPIKNRGVEVVNGMKAFGGGYKARYQATGGFWPIPSPQIDLSNGVLVQNKGWGTPEDEFPGW